MTAHPTPTEKLLALLEDEAVVESLAADEVRGDLALLGIDPAPSISFARTLAAGHGTPGGRLLGGIDAAEDAEDEIARIEAADIGDVRAQIPGAAAAAIAAEARRRAGGGSNVVGIRQRRRRALIWGAPAAGIAASLLVVVVGYEVLKVNLMEIEMQLQGAQSAAPSAAAESEASPPAAESEALRSDGSSRPRESPTASISRQDSAPEADESADAVMAKRARREAAAPPPAVALGNEAREAPAGDMAPADVEDADNAERGFFRAAPDSTTDSVARNREQNPEEKSIAGAGRGMTGSGDTAVGLLAEPASPEPEGPAESFAAKSFADEAGAAPRVVAVLVVDADRTPLSIKSKNLPAGRLADRLDEARRVAAGRDVVALIALETPAGQVDFAQVALSPGLSQQLAPPLPIAGLLGADAAAYDFIALPLP